MRSLFALTRRSTAWPGRAFALACALAGTLGCASLPPAPQPCVGEPCQPPSDEARTRWLGALGRFAELDAGTWNGAACHEALAIFESVDTEGWSRAQVARPLYMRGLIASRCGNSERAREFYDNALRYDPSLCEAHVGLGLDALSRDRRPEARAHFARAVERDHLCAPGYVNLAVMQSAEPNLADEALSNLRRALSARADYLPALVQMASIYLNLSSERPELLDLAEIVCRQVQLIDAEHAPIYNVWGLIAAERGQITEAVARFGRAMELDDGFFEAHMNFGQLTLSQRAYEDAARAFTRARELRPRSYDAIVGLGVALRGLTRPEEAERLYLAAIAVDQTRPEAYFNLGVLFQEHRGGSGEELMQARRYLQAFVERAGHNPRYREVVMAVTRTCSASPRSPSARRRGTSPCRPGRLANIQTAYELIHESALPPPD